MTVEPNPDYLYYRNPERRKRDQARHAFILVVCTKDPKPMECARKIRADWLKKAVESWQQTRRIYSMGEWFKRVKPQTVTIEIDVEYYPDTTWTDVRRHVVNQAKAQFDAARDQARQTEGLGERDRYPDYDLVERDALFVYQRVALEWSDMEIWRQWQEEHARSGDAITYERVREIISDTARLLEIEL